MNGDAPQLSHAQQPDIVDDAEQSVGIVLNGDVDSSLNGHHDSSPISPATPVSNVLASDAKIDVDYQEQESDARSEPLPAKTVQSVEQHSPQDASTVAQVVAPPDPNAIAVVEAPSSMVEDSQDVTPTPVNGGVNGTHVDPDVSMADNDEQTPVTTPGISGSFTSTAESVGVSTSHTTPNDAPDDDDDEDKPPPAKRPRVYSDADKASLAHSASPPPTSAATSNVNTPVPPPSADSLPQGPSTLSVAQYRFCQSTIRSLKKLKDAAPFLRPVDPVALNIPHYPSIIKNPMDFSTIERKLTASNPVKPDPNPQNPRYLSADEFIADVRLIMSNCVTFNGPDHAITTMGKRVEEVFDKQIKNMPSAEVKPPVVKKQPTPPQVQPPSTAPPPPPAAPATAPAKKAQPPRRPSTSIPVIRRSDAPEVVGRPKREIHPPPPKDLAYADAPKKPRKVKRDKEGGSSEQLKYCYKILSDLHKKQHYAIANPFYEPVDWVRLEIPSYPKIIKRPMDLSTMKRKLDMNEYPNAQKFYDDFKLMIRNCFTFNPAGTPVNQAGQELQRLFDEKWKNLPPENVSEDEEEEEEDDSDDERARTIAMMESQIETIRGTISALKNKPTKDKKKKAKQEKAPVPSTSKAVPKPSKATSSSKKKGKKPVADDDVLSFDQKKDLSEAIGKLEGAKLEKVIGIIHEGVPEIRDSTEEIELEIDLLPATVLTRLYNFVIRPMKPAPPKRSRPGKGTGTGGLKRKSMDENVEAERIRQLEQRMKLFEQGANGAAAPAARANDSDHSSDSSSDDSSGSDSE